MSLLCKKGLIVSSFSFTLVKSRNMSEGIRNAIIKKNSSKVYKSIANNLEIPVLAVHKVIKKFGRHKMLRCFQDWEETRREKSAKVDVDCGKNTKQEI